MHSHHTHSPIGARNVSGILTHRLSDHQPYFLVIDPILVKQVPPKMVESRRLNTKNINDFVDALSASNMYDQLNTERGCDPNENYNILYSIISNSINEYFPSKMIKFKKHKHKHSKWITRGIIKSIIYN